MTRPLESRFADQLDALGLVPARVVLGVSGGPDSLALLLLMHRVAAPRGFELIVAHADHGLHPDSAAVAETVAGRAASLGVEAVIGTLRLAPGTGEDAARQARHAWLHQVLADRGAQYICLAHQREDQAETVLMRVLAGSGPAGLAAMQPVRGVIVRPLLGFSRAELGGYLDSAGWTAWPDPANRDPRFTRSWLRHTVLPLLAEREPAVTELLVRTASQAGEARRAWDAVLDILPGLDPHGESSGVSVAAAPLLGYDSGLARVVLQAMARRAGATLGSAAADRVIRLVAVGRSGAWVPLGAGWRAELAFDRLRIVPGEGTAGFEPVVIGGVVAGAVRCGPWTVRWGREAAPDLVPRDGWTSWFIPGTWTLRSWRSGDRIRPRGGRGTRLAVRCMQDARVARTDRSSWPVVIGEPAGPIVWIPGICRAEDAVPLPGSEAMRIDVDPG